MFQVGLSSDDEYEIIYFWATSWENWAYCVYISSCVSHCSHCFLFPNLIILHLLGFVVRLARQWDKTGFGFLFWKHKTGFFAYNIASQHLMILLSPPHSMYQLLFLSLMISLCFPVATGYAASPLVFLFFILITLHPLIPLLTSASVLISLFG